MKILHITNYFQPQIGYQETFLAKEQIKQGHEVSVITSDRYYPFVDFDKTYKNLLGDRICGSGFVNIDGIPIYRLKTLGEIKCRVWLLGLEQKVKELKPDYVHVHAVLANAFRMMKLKKRGMNFKLVIDEHLIDLVRDKSILAKIHNRIKKGRLKPYLQYSDKFVGVTKETCKILEKDFGIPSSKIKYIPLGADSTLFKFDQQERQKIREQYNIQIQDILLLYTGKIDPSKGVQTLISAFNSMTRYKNVYLLMVGSENVNFISGLLNSMNESQRNRIILKDFVENSKLPQYFSAADICVWGDTITASMLEAMSCGRPIVGCDIPPVIERIEYDNGMAYKFGDYNDLKDKLEFLIQNPKIGIQMGARGRQLVEDKLSWQVISKRFLSI